MNKEHFESRNAMHAFADANLSELCAELAEWQETGLLRDGKMRQLAQLCTFVSYGELTQAERLVERQAIRKLAHDHQAASTDLEQQARELFAVEYERGGKIGAAEHIRTQPLLPNKARAVRAIAAALRQQPAPVDLKQFREAVVCWYDAALPANDVEVERKVEAKRLLSIIDSAGKVECAEPVAWITPESIRHLAKMNGPANVVVWNCASGNARVPLYAVPQQPAPVVDDACNWRQQDEDGDHISTGCGHEFILNDAGDYEDGRPVFSFCCFCSKPTMFHRWRDEPECSCDHSDGDAPECEGCADRRNRAALARAQGVQS